MRKTDRGTFKPSNPQKYVGDPAKITYRSSWELTTMNFFDRHPNVIQWSSETLQIPYLNPLTSKWTIYVPDFLVLTDDGRGNRQMIMIEIKPIAQTPGHIALSESGKPRRMSKYNLKEQIRNEAKWKAALEFCNKRKIQFQVVTEQTMFGHTSRRKK